MIGDSGVTRGLDMNALEANQQLEVLIQAGLLAGTEMYGHEMPMSTTISSVVQISPPDAVSRRGVSWTGMAGEIVQANRRGRINFQFCAPVHMLAV